MISQRKVVTTGLAWLSLASGGLKLMEFSGDSRTVGVRLRQELERIAPAEILRADGSGAELFEDDGSAHTQRVPDWHFDVVGGHKALLDQLGVATLTGFGADGLGAAFGAAGALLRYAQGNHVDLIVLGAATHGLPMQRLLATVPIKVAMDAPCTVILIKQELPFALLGQPGAAASG